MARNKETAKSIEAKLKSLNSEASLRSSFTRQIHGSIDQESSASFGVIRGEDNSSTRRLMNYITVINTDIAKYVLYALYDKHSKSKKGSNDFSKLANNFVESCIKYVGVDEKRKEQIDTDELKKLLKELFPKEKAAHAEKPQNMPSLEELRKTLDQQEARKIAEIRELEMRKKALEDQEKERKKEEKPKTVVLDSTKLPPLPPKQQQLQPAQRNPEPNPSKPVQPAPVNVDNKDTLTPNPPQPEQQPVQQEVPIIQKPNREQPPAVKVSDRILNSTTTIYSRSVNNLGSTVEQLREIMSRSEKQRQKLDEAYKQAQPQIATPPKKEEVKKSPEQEQLELLEMRLKGGADGGCS